MSQSASAKIFLSDERGIYQTASTRSRNTFNNDRCFNEYKQPFGALTVINDEALDAGCSTQLVIGAYTCTILLPVMGAIICRRPDGAENMVAAGEVAMFTIDKGETVQITNPFEDGLINYLQIGIKAGPLNGRAKPEIVSYDVNASINSLVKLFSSTSSSLMHAPDISVGKFSGRGETIHHISNKGSGLFVFVIEGAFEVEGRLLHARDGLALWSTDEAEIEALSNDAILLAIETPLTDLQ